MTDSYDWAEWEAKEAEADAALSAWVVADDMRAAALFARVEAEEAEAAAALFADIDPYPALFAEPNADTERTPPSREGSP